MADEWPRGRGYLKGLIVERPMRYAPPACPFCGAADPELLAHEHTLLGEAEEYYNDPARTANHHWMGMRCCSCGKQFSFQYKRGWCWYTEMEHGKKVLKGVSACFEQVDYTCAHCGGNVERDESRVQRSGRLDEEWRNDPYVCQSCRREAT